MNLSFEYGDAQARAFSREMMVSEWRRMWDRKTTLWILAGTGLFVWAMLTPTSPLWWRLLTGLVPAGAGLVALLWLAAFLWAPRKAAAKMAHLPHRRVDVVLSERTFAIRAATESMELDWSEVVEARTLPTFVAVKTRAGGILPLPRAALGEAGEAELRRRVASSR